MHEPGWRMAMAVRPTARDRAYRDVRFKGEQSAGSCTCVHENCGALDWANRWRIGTMPRLGVCGTKPDMFLDAVI